MKKIFFFFLLSLFTTGVIRAQPNNAGLRLNALGFSAGFVDAFIIGNNASDYDCFFKNLELFRQSKIGYTECSDLEWSGSPAVHLQIEFRHSRLPRSRFTAGFTYSGYSTGKLKIEKNTSHYLGYSGTSMGPAAYNTYSISNEKYVFLYQSRSISGDIGYGFDLISKKRFTVFTGSNLRFGKKINGIANADYSKVVGDVFFLAPFQNLTYEPDNYFENVTKTEKSGSAILNLYFGSVSVPAGIEWAPIKKDTRLTLTTTCNAGIEFAYRKGTTFNKNLHYNLQSGVRWSFRK